MGFMVAELGDIFGSKPHTGSMGFLCGVYKVLGSPTTTTMLLSCGSPKVLVKQYQSYGV